MNPPVKRIQWAKSYRLIPSKYPPIDLFEDIAPPEDWEVLAQAEARSNPRIYEEIGVLSLVPVNRRISGKGASWVMGAFTHISPDRYTRFSDGSYGVYYCGKQLETALRESAYHQGKFLSATDEPAGCSIEMREIIATINHRFHDLRQGNYAKYLQMDDYTSSQDLAKQLRSKGGNGIVYPSVRHEGGECLAVFWPDIVSAPTQGGHWVYHWDGEKVDYVKQLDNSEEKSTVYKL